MKRWLTGLLALACASFSPPASAAIGVPVPRVQGEPDGRGWQGVWLPTLDVLDVPALDWLSPFEAQTARSFVAHQPAAVLPATLLTLLQRQPLGAEGLWRLKLAGRLTPALLTSLAQLATGPLAPGLDRATLLGQLLAELAVPARIIQGTKLTCEVTSTQILLAERAPAEYARLVAGLAAPGGRVRLASGEAIARVPDWASPTDGWRSLPGRLLQPAFATFGEAPLSYSNTLDLDSIGINGLTDAQFAKLLGALFAQPFCWLSPENSTKAGRLLAYRAAIAHGWHVPTWVNWGAGHIVLALPPRADGRVVLDNPYGVRHHRRLRLPPHRPAGPAAARRGLGSDPRRPRLHAAELRLSRSPCRAAKRGRHGSLWPLDPARRLPARAGHAPAPAVRDPERRGAGAHPSARPAYF